MAPHAAAGADEQSVQQLRDWASKQPHLPAVPDKLLVRMLHSCHGSVERTKTAVDNFLTITTHAPDVFGNLAVFDDRYHTAMSIMHMVPLQERTKEGYRPILFKFQDTDSSKFDMVGVVHSALAGLHTQVDLDDCIPGYLALFDFTGLTMGHIVKISLTCLKQLLVFVQEGLPLRLTGIHFINSVPLVQNIVNMVKPLMKKELIDIFHVHTVDEMPKFYEKFVSQSSMPKEYGGDAGSCADLHDGLVKQIVSCAWLPVLDTLQVNESRRVGKSKSASDVFGIQGSFKKLDLD